MTKVRFRSPYVVFRIPGKSLCRGATPAFYRARGERKEFSEYNDRKAQIRQQRASVIRMIAKSAMKEQDWEITDKPVYLIITVHTRISNRVLKPKREEMLKSGELPLQFPQLDTALRVYAKALTGVVFKKLSQIAATLIMKRYTDGDEFVDVLVGRPASYEDLIYDIRNN